MVDKISKSKRSSNMAAIKGKNTSPEIIVRTEVFKKGFRFRLHDKTLPGRPDIVFKRYKIAVFVNGCFWHGHNCKKGKRPSTNKDFWNQKIDNNIARDTLVTDKLIASGWSVITIWGCDLVEGTKSLISTLQKRKRYQAAE